MKHTRRYIIHTAALMICAFIFLAGCKSSGESLATVSVKEAHTMIEKLQDNQDFMLLDIRTPPEYKSGHIRNAVIIDFYAKDFLDRMNQLDEKKTYLMYSRSGNRSGIALKQIEKMNFRKVYNMAGGIKEWVKNGYKIVK